MEVSLNVYFSTSLRRKMILRKAYVGYSLILDVSELNKKKKQVANERSCVKF